MHNFGYFFTSFLFANQMVRQFLSVQMIKACSYFPHSYSIFGLLLSITFQLNLNHENLFYTYPKECALYQCLLHLHYVHYNQIYCIYQYPKWTIPNGFLLHRVLCYSLVHVESQRVRLLKIHLSQSTVQYQSLFWVFR